MAGKFELYTDKAGEYRFRLKAGNGEIILASEGYKQKASALNGIDSVKKNSAVDERYERKDSASGKPMFNLKATNGQVIGTSETYSSASARDNGIASVMKNAPDDAKYERKEAKSGPMFNLKATNGQVIGTSEVYSSASSRDNGIESVKKNAPDAKIEDMTA